MADGTDRAVRLVVVAALLLVAVGAGTASALAWQNETVDTADRVGLFTSLALDNAGNPRIGYYADTNRDLVYAWRDGAGWHTETVDSQGAVGEHASLALDNAGNPRISYLDGTNDDLKFAWRDGAGWQNATVDAAGDVGAFTSLALDGAGNPRISYHDATHESLKYAWADRPAVVAVPGGSGAPTDPGADGLYDDVNGNGRKDFADVVLYFNQMNWIGANEPIECFDCNANGRIDFADVVRLFNAL